MRRALGLTLALLLAFAACDGGDENSGGTTTTTLSRASSTTTPGDPFAIPATIDEAYTQRVIDELYAIEADAARIIVDRGDIVPDAAQRLKAVFGDYQLNQELEVWNEAVREKFDGLRQPPGAVEVTVESLVRADGSCVQAKTRVDVASRYISPNGPFTLYTVLASTTDPSPMNRTPWVVRYQGAGGPDGEQLSFDPCVSLPSS